MLVQDALILALFAAGMTAAYMAGRARGKRLDGIDLGHGVQVLLDEDGSGLV